MCDGVCVNVVVEMGGCSLCDRSWSHLTIDVRPSHSGHRLCSNTLSHIHLPPLPYPTLPYLNTRARVRTWVDSSVNSQSSMNSQRWKREVSLVWGTACTRATMASVMAFLYSKPPGCTYIHTYMHTLCVFDGVRAGVVVRERWLIVWG